MGILERVQLPEGKVFRRMGPSLVKTLLSLQTTAPAIFLMTGAEVAGGEHPSLSHPCSLHPPHLLPALSCLSAVEKKLMCSSAICNTLPSHPLCLLMFRIFLFGGGWWVVSCFQMLVPKGRRHRRTKIPEPNLAPHATIPILLQGFNSCTAPPFLWM